MSAKNTRRANGSGEKKAAPEPPRYEVIICWSKADAAFVAEVPELPGCAADGTTYQEVAANVEVVIREWIETAKEPGSADHGAEGATAVRVSRAAGHAGRFLAGAVPAQSWNVINLRF